MRQGIEVAFLSSRGKYEGRLQPEFTKNAVIRLKQYQRAANPEFCVKVAATIVTGKVRNMIAMIKQQRRLREALREGRREDGRPPLAELEAMPPRIASAQSIENLNGHEGAASVAYFKAFRAAIKVDGGDWKFDSRQYHPPQDPVNALLSLGYTLLYNDLYAAVNVVGLDPFMGFYHQPRHGHAALSSDLMEEHRATLVDRMILTLINKRIIAESDFQRDPEGRIQLKQDALKRFFGFYAQTVQEKTFYPYSAIQTSYRQVIELQVRHFARVLMDEEPVYHPFNAEAAMNGKQ